MTSVGRKADNNEVSGENDPPTLSTPALNSPLTSPLTSAQTSPLTSPQTSPHTAPLASSARASSPTATTLEMKRPFRPDVQPGKRLGRYRLDAMLGTGAFSTVFRGHDTALDLPVVIKVLSDDASEAAAERFRREILFSRRVAHPGFSRIFELHETHRDDAETGPVPASGGCGPLRYLTMELVEGRTLGDLMNEGPMPPLRALTIARDLCDIVAAAHDQGVVHGDLKPSNVMLRATPRRSVTDRWQEPKDDLVILDFGAASAADMTDPGVRVGSVRYMAPELFEADKPSPQSDVWAIGVVLYGCLTGRYPFDGDNDRAVAEAARRTAPKPPSTVRPLIPALVDDVVLQALRRDRTDRHPDCRAFRKALDAILAELRQSQRPSVWQRLLRLVHP